MRTLLWLCMLMLGLQFCAPSALHAAVLSGVVDELSLRTADPEAPEEDVELDEDLALIGWPGAFPGASPSVHGSLLRQRDDDDRTAQELLSVAGFQPSAP
ncbi:MAG: hypothetical protein KA791_08005 [Flavobacteriales bacterium]|nr:hypothetical protein [Flavobacteriales bacterium]